MPRSTLYAALGSLGVGIALVIGSSLGSHSKESTTASSNPGPALSGQPSYVGQTGGDYCLECLTRHYSKALGLLKEAERFSLREGRITAEARQRIRCAMEEMVTAEEDFEAGKRDSELRDVIERIDREQRATRKWMWSQKLLSSQEDLAALRECIPRIERLVNMSYEASERYHKSPDVTKLETALGFDGAQSLREAERHIREYQEKSLCRWCKKEAEPIREAISELHNLQEMGEKAVTAEEKIQRVKAEGEKMSKMRDELSKMVVEIGE